MNESEMSFEYNEKEYYPKLFEVLENVVVANIIIRSGYARLYRTTQMLPYLQRAIARGVLVCVFFQDPRREKNPDPAYIKEFDEVVALLISIGVHVNIRRAIHHKIIIIDNYSCFTGSLNTSSWGGITEENMTYWPNSKRKTTEVRLKYGMDSCTQCAKNKPPGQTLEENLKSLGASIAKNRNAIGMTQEELAKSIGVDKSRISAIEAGKANPRFSTILRLNKVLALSNRNVPEFMARGIDDQLSKWSE